MEIHIPIKQCLLCKYRPSVRLYRYYTSFLSTWKHPSDTTSKNCRAGWITSVHFTVVPPTQTWPVMWQLMSRRHPAQRYGVQIRFCSLNPNSWQTYSISLKICTLFCCYLFRCGHQPLLDSPSCGMYPPISFKVASLSLGKSYGRLPDW